MPRHLWVEHEAERWQRVRKQEREKQNKKMKEKRKTSFLKTFAHQSQLYFTESGETIGKQILQNNASQVTATPGKRSHF